MHKVLIVDDEKPVRIAIAKLGKWNHWNIAPPVYAENGQEALHTMVEIHPSIVFVDMQMPIMNGVEFLKRASSLCPDGKCIFIVISGYDDFTYARDAMHYGAKDYLLKPVVADELNIAIERAMKALYPEEDFAIASSAAPPEMTVDEVVDLIYNTINTRYSENIRISDFAERYFFSREYLSRQFKAKYGTGIYEYLTGVRMKRACELLKDSEVSISDIAARVGFTDSNYFSKAFHAYTGSTPSEYRRGEHPGCC